MHRFAHLCEALDRGAVACPAAPTPLAPLLHYLQEAPPADAAWAVYFLVGGRLKPALSPAQAQAAALELSGLPPWLFEECSAAATDLAECLALVMPPATALTQHSLAHWVEHRLLPLRGLPANQIAAALAQACDELEVGGRQLTLKLLLGSWRSPVSALQVQHTLARLAGISTYAVALRLQGFAAPQKMPNAAGYKALVATGAASNSDSNSNSNSNASADFGADPYPFTAVQPLAREQPVASLGPIDQWLLNWHWGGLPAQVVRRGGGCFIWSAQRELLTARLPEVQAACAALPEGTVLSGELLAWTAGADGPVPVQRLQQRLQRKTLTAVQRRDAPAVFVVHDLLEWKGCDLRTLPLRQRQVHLEQWLAGQPPAPALRGALLLNPADWPAAALQGQAARARGALGLLLRSLASDAAWVWLPAPMSVTAVLLYAQTGSGGSGGTPGGSGGAAAGPFRDYSFGVWNRAPHDENEVQGVLAAIAAKRPPPTDPTALRWVSLAKARDGLSAPDMAVLQATVRTTAVEKFGPVRSLKPSLVVELVFDRLTPSKRHKSGLLLEGVRMTALRPDFPLRQVDHLATLQRWLNDAVP